MSASEYGSVPIDVLNNFVIELACDPVINDQHKD